MSDGALDVPELIARVTGRGVRPSVSDHISRDVTGAVDFVRSGAETIGFTRDGFYVVRRG